MDKTNSILSVFKSCRQVKIFLRKYFITTSWRRVSMINEFHPIIKIKSVKSVKSIKFCNCWLQFVLLAGTDCHCPIYLCHKAVMRSKLMGQLWAIEISTSFLKADQGVYVVMSIDLSSHTGSLLSSLIRSNWTIEILAKTINQYLSQVH